MLPAMRNGPSGAERLGRMAATTVRAAAAPSSAPRQRRMSCNRIGLPLRRVTGGKVLSDIKYEVLRPGSSDSALALPMLVPSHHRTLAGEPRSSPCLLYT